tara:strand:+ start:284 stop:901 length:618 start_codon:yes stop_codon:yes gene_type:complete
MNQFIATHGEDTLRAENKALKAENEKLKEEILHKSQSGTAIDSEVVEQLFQIFDEDVATCDIPEKVTKLQEDNEKLKQQNNTIGMYQKLIKTLQTQKQVLNKEVKELKAKDCECECGGPECDRYGSYDQMIKGIDGDGDEILFHPDCIEENHPDDFNICHDCNIYHHCDKSETGFTEARGILDFCPECWDDMSEEDKEELRMKDQ